MVLKMINKNEANKIIVLSNEKMEIGLCFMNGFRVSSFVHKSLRPDNIAQKPMEELFRLDIEGQCFMSSQFEVLEISESRDKVEEMVSVLLEEKSAGILSKVCIINKPDNTINLVVQLAVQWKDSYLREVYLHIPFLSAFSLGDADEEEFYFPANPASKANGSSSMQLNDDFKLPLGIFEKCSGKGFGIQFPVVDPHVRDWDQNRNHDLNEIRSLEQLRNHSLLLRTYQSLTDIFEIKFTAIDNGWPECFKLWREDMRKELYFSQYEREDLKWYRETFLQHFTFFYGKEIYNYETNQVEMGRLIRQGEDFGGYDAIILWHQYPRLGVDQRDQWDFFNDFPGGKAGIKKAVEEAHSYGVKVFIPFKPWDVGSGKSPDSVTESVAELIEETDVDGIFFDTMNTVPAGFREAIDRRKPGVVFCTEGKPIFKHNIEMITGSWNQQFDTMPEIYLLRYVLPEHFISVLGRWNMGARKDMLIQKAVLNGTGILIWQDIFGTWLPYSPEQKAAIKKWKKILSENKDIYFCSNPIPLYPTLREGLVCNCFLSDHGDGVIYSLYNDTDEHIDGDLFIFNISGHVDRIAECWKGVRIDIRTDGERKIVCGSIAPKEILVIKISGKELLNK
jgi:hypothetical protein